MPINYQSPFGEEVWAQAQPDLLTIQNNGGVWNPAGAQYIRVTENSLHMSPEEPKVAPNIKHGTASQLARLQARKSGSWSLNAPIVPSGVAAVAPDTDILFQSVFGGAGGVVGGSLFGNAWAYTIHDRQCVPLTLLGFQNGVAATGNRYSLGCVTTRVGIDFNGNILGLNMNGVSVAVAENESFPNLDLPAKGGLGTYPGQPGSFATVGNQLVNAFGGQLYVNNTLVSNQCDSLAVEFTTGIGLKGNVVDSAYPVATIYNQRSATVSIGCMNNDSAVLAQMKNWARANTPVSVSFYLGTVPGMRMYVYISGVQLLPATLSDAQGYITASFGNSASSVLPGLANDISIGFA